MMKRNLKESLLNATESIIGSATMIIMAIKRKASQSKPRKISWKRKEIIKKIFDNHI